MDDIVAPPPTAYNGDKSGLSRPGRLREAAPIPQKDVLSNVHVQLRAGELVAVVGAVGSSKTSLLLGLLGELQPSGSGSSGELEVQAPGAAWIKPGCNAAYVPQESWI